MSAIHSIRFYHAALAVLTLLSYITGELGLVHAWLGYGVGAVILFRLLWAAVGSRQVGLSRFHPSFDGLRIDNFVNHPAISKTLILGIAVCLVLTVGTGVAIDQGRSIGIADASFISQAYADDDDAGERGYEDEEEGILTEAHEVVANLLLLLVGMHIGYLFAFKRPLAKFMLFLNSAKKGAA
jgi:cytochrome b